MNFIAQITARRKAINRRIIDISRIVGMLPSNLYRILNKESDIRASTLNDLAMALDAQWILVPKHLLPEVERLISGKVIGVDDAPSTIERLLGRENT